MFIAAGDALIYPNSFGRATAPVIVGIGGWIGNWELWAEPFAILSQNWRTIGYDHRGVGATIAPPESITSETLVEDVIVVLDACQVEQCVLAAESAGAITALCAALREPRRVSGLVIVDGLYHSHVRSESDPFVVELTGISQPALVFHGDADHLIPVEEGRRLAEALPNARFVLLHGAGHVPTLTRPAEIARQINRFFGVAT